VHFSAEELWIGIETGKLLPWYHGWCICQSPILARWPCHSMCLLFLLWRGLLLAALTPWCGGANIVMSLPWCVWVGGCVCVSGWVWVGGCVGVYVSTIEWKSWLEWLETWHSSSPRHCRILLILGSKGQGSGLGSAHTF